LKAKFIKIIFEPLLRLGFSHKIQATALWSMLESFSNPFFSLLLLPIFTHNLGLENYGLYVMVMAFVSLFGFAGLGMNTSVTYFLAANYKTSNPKQIAERLTSALLITLISTIFFSCLFLLMLHIFEIQFKEHYPQLIGKEKLIYIALGLVVVTQLDAVVSSAIKGLQQFKTSSKVEFVLRSLSFMTVALIAITQKTIESIILVSLILALFNIIVRYVLLSKTVIFRIGEIKINKQFTSEHFNFGKWMTLQNLSGAIFSSLDKILLGLLFNTTIVATYNIITSITQLSHYILASAISFIMPKVSANLKINTRLQDSYYKVLALSALVTFLMLFILAILYPFVSNHFNLGSIENEYFLLLLSYGILAMCVPPYFFALAFGKVKLLSNINTVSAIVGIIAMIYLINPLGIYGAALARLSYAIIVITTFLIPSVFFKKNIPNPQ
jgi:O-antigen/teichoic acid export membrane protein